MYKPPFTITNKMLSLCISITEKVGQINNYQSLKRMPILRKNNRINNKNYYNSFIDVISNEFDFANGVWKEKLCTGC